MPPTLPFGGIPRVGILFARLVVHGEDRGVRPFVVPLNDGKSMCKGITAKLVFCLTCSDEAYSYCNHRELPTRVGTRAFGHAITTFDHVRVPFSALLGSIEKASDEREHFMKTIWRVSVGTLCLTSTAIAALKVSVYVTATYSKRRSITGPKAQQIPVITFRTQQAPILHALAQGYVLDAFYQQATEWFTSTPQEDLSRRNAIAAIFKATVLGHWRRTGCTLADRCGAQDMFEYNQIRVFEVRGLLSSSPFMFNAKLVSIIG